MHKYIIIEIDSINGMLMEAYLIEMAKRKKGRLAGPVEIIYLNPGLYHVTAHAASDDGKNVDGGIDSGLMTSKNIIRLRRSANN